MRYKEVILDIVSSVSGSVKKIENRLLLNGGEKTMVTVVLLIRHIHNSYTRSARADFFHLSPDNSANEF